MTQFHIVYYNWFHIVSSIKYSIKKCWGGLVESERYNFMIDLYNYMQLEEDKQLKEPELSDE